MTTSLNTSSSKQATARRQVVAASVGNAVEWFDWFIYSMLAVFFAGQFFPADSEDSLVPLLSTMAVFAVGFFARPLGGLVIGALADRFGRRRALSFTIIGMGMGSLIIGVAPTYDQVGVLAPALILVARIIQGLSAGGEYAAASAFLIESAPDGKRGLFSSFLYISATAALLAAIGISALLSNTLDADSMATWGWRVPFILGAGAAVIGLWIRSHSVETLTTTEANDGTGAAPRERAPMFEFFAHHPKESLQVFGLTAAPALAFYVWTSYLPTFASITVGFNPAKGLASGVIALTVFLALQPIMGALSDRIGRRPLLLAFGLFFAVATVPLLASLAQSFTSMLLIQVAGLAFLACWSSISAAVAAEMFPAAVRGAGIGFPYALAVAVFGGTGPYVATWLVDIGHATAFGWYISAVALFSTVVYLTLPETAKRPLR